jgi:hypothetical protein
VHALMQAGQQKRLKQQQHSHSPVRHRTRIIMHRSASRIAPAKLARTIPDMMKAYTSDSTTQRQVSSVSSSSFQLQDNRPRPPLACRPSHIFRGYVPSHSSGEKRTKRAQADDENHRRNHRCKLLRSHFGWSSTTASAISPHAGGSGFCRCPPAPPAGISSHLPPTSRLGEAVSLQVALPGQNSCVAAICQSSSSTRDADSIALARPMHSPVRCLGRKRITHCDRIQHWPSNDVTASQSPRRIIYQAPTSASFPSMALHDKSLFPRDARRLTEIEALKQGR